MSGKKAENAVTVGVRIRPLNDKELAASMPVCFSPTPDESGVEEIDESTGDVNKTWPYDHVFGPQSTNQSIFDTVGVKLVDAALDGYNTVLFMYGQTSSGKTFTLFGGGNVSGLVMHAMEHVHHRVTTSTDTEYVIRLTYSELYNEELRDLLSPTPNENLKIIDDPTLGPQIQNITEANFATPLEIKNLLAEGENRRHFGVTNMNAHSSRSHVMVRLTIETRKVGTKPANPLRTSWGRDKPTCISTLNLVDLAGSERANKSGTSGQALKEGSFINKSLLTLGTVISSLSEGKAGQHVPYRDSKLTRLLASALGGNAKTLMMTCVSPASGNVVESLSTLRFASRAKRIVNLVRKNEIQDVKSLSSKLALQNAEIEELRNKLDLSRQLGFMSDGSEESLKDKAISASKNWRSLKFLMINSPKIIKALKQQGLQQLAKQVQADVKAAIAGTRDLSEIIEEQSALLQNHLPKEIRLIQKLEDLARENETDTIVGPGSGGSGSSRHHHLDDDHSDTDSHAEVFTGMEIDSEESMEKLENAQLSAEDLRSAASKVIAALKDDKIAAAVRERGLKSHCDELNGTIRDLQDDLRKLRMSESSIQTELNMVKKSSKDDLSASSTMSEKMQSRIHQLQQTIAERDVNISSLQGQVLTKEGEVDHLKSQVEKLTKDVASALTSKRAVEEEATRIRNEMRTQMDKLRANMHSLLKQGGEESQVIQSQNSQLQKEADDACDALEAVKISRDQLHDEVNLLRMEVQNYYDNEKCHIDELNVAKEQNFKMIKNLQSLRVDITQLTAVNQQSEKCIHQLKTEKEEISRARDAMVLEKEAVTKQLKTQLSSGTAAFQLEIHSLNLEVQALKEQLDSKQSFVLKIEHTLNVETARLEKKLHAQSKTNEDLLQESASASQQHFAATEKLHEELRAARVRVAELQAYADSVDHFLQTNGLDSDDVDNEDGEDCTDSPGATSSLTSHKQRNDNDAEAEEYWRRPMYRLDISNHAHGYDNSNPASPRERSSPLSTRRYRKSIDSDEISNAAGESASSRRKPGRDRDSPPSFWTDHGSEKDDTYSSLVPKRNKLIDYRARVQWMNDVMATNELVEAEQFAALHIGASLVTTCLQYSLHDRQLQSQFLEHENSQKSRCLLESAHAIKNLQDNEKFLQDSRTHLQNQLEYFHHREQQWDNESAGLTVLVDQLRQERAESSLAATIAQDNWRQVESLRDSISLQLEHAKADNFELARTNNDLTGVIEDRTQDLERLGEKYYLLQSQAGQLEQEMGVLQVERDELYKRFIGDYNAHASMRSTPSAAQGRQRERRSDIDTSRDRDTHTHAYDSPSLRQSNSFEVACSQGSCTGESANGGKLSDRQRAGNFRSSLSSGNTGTGTSTNAPYLHRDSDKFSGQSSPVSLFEYHSKIVSSGSVGSIAGSFNRHVHISNRNSGETLANFDPDDITGRAD